MGLAEAVRVLRRGGLVRGADGYHGKLTRLWLDASHGRWHAHVKVGWMTRTYRLAEISPKDLTRSL
jgi:hypothetical protein